MAQLLLSPNEQGIVSFQIWKTLQYKSRLLLAGSIILIGFFLQYWFFSVFPGVIFIFLGNLLLLPSGYNNRVNTGKFDPAAEWETVNADKLDQISEFHNKIRKWDRSVLDISNPLGFLFFLAVAAPIGIMAIVWLDTDHTFYLIMAVDIPALLIPYWFTGMRTMTSISNNLLRQLTLFRNLLKQTEKRLGKEDYKFLLLIPGGEPKIPRDIKLKVPCKELGKDFMGMYGQITFNSVNEVPQPYFYIVLVAKQSFGLDGVKHRLSLGNTMVSELKIQEGNHILVIRQNADIPRGYTTNSKQIFAIFNTGLDILERLKKGHA